MHPLIWGKPIKKKLVASKKLSSKIKKSFLANQKNFFSQSKKTFSTSLQASLGESGDFVPIKKKLSVLVVVVVVVVVVVGAPPPYQPPPPTYSSNTHLLYSVFTVLSSCRTRRRFWTGFFLGGVGGRGG